MAITAQQIIESIPARFRTEKAMGLNTVFHFQITGDEELQYTVTIKDGAISLSTGLNGKPDCIIEAKANNYIDIETGKANPQMALMTGKIKVSNLSAMMQFAKCFRKFEAQTECAPVATIMRQAKIGPLAGLKIIDFTRLLPGPMATMFLADMGADVIKVEDPDNPDYIRGFEPQVGNTSMYYLALNRNKRSLAVNYLSAEGKKLIYDLVKSADVLVEQFRPGVMKELGFGFAELLKINPKLIYVSITGYGQNSGRAQQAGHDLNYIAIAGALDITGTENGAPVIPGFQLADIAGGSYMAMNAVLAALYQRNVTGKGEWVDVSMTDAVLPFTALQFASYQANKVEPGRGNFELSGGIANYNVYKSSDGRYLALGSLEPKFWQKFCKVIGKPEWNDAFMWKDEQQRQLKLQLQEFFVTKSAEEWQSILTSADICFTLVNSLSNLATDEYLVERKMFVDHVHPAIGNYKTINQPLKFIQAAFENKWNAPELGDDTADILKELNYTSAQVDSLKEKKLIKAK